MSEDFTLDELRSNPEIYWLSSAIQELNIDRQVLNDLQELFEGYYGDCIIRKYQLTPGAILATLIQNNRLDEVDFVSSFLRLDNMIDLRNELKLPGGDFDVEIKDYRTDIFTFGGTIAGMLCFGGAYARMDRHKAWDLGLRLCKEVYENRFRDVQFFRISLPDADWFDRIAWDYCFLLVDQKTMQVLFFCTTGTD